VRAVNERGYFWLDTSNSFSPKHRVLGIRFEGRKTVTPWDDARRVVAAADTTVGYVKVCLNGEIRVWPKPAKMYCNQFPIANTSFKRGKWLLDNKDFPAELVNAILDLLEKQKTFAYSIKLYVWTILQCKFAEVNHLAEKVAVVHLSTPRSAYLFRRQGRKWIPSPLEGDIIGFVRCTETKDHALVVLHENTRFFRYGTSLIAYYVDLKTGRVEILPPALPLLLVDSGTRR
jgi:hypothetical protein